MNWVDYWNGKPTIYVSARHQQAHDAVVAACIAPFVVDASGCVLDFGCGDATRAHLVAERCAKLLLWDAAPSVRQRLSERYAGHGKITVLSPDGLAGIEAGSIDLITVISVIQYLQPSELSELLTNCQRMLSPRGALIIGDVIPPDVGMVHDAWALLSFAGREGFLPAAVTGLIKTAFSDYRTIRSKLQLKTYSQSEIVQLLSSHGYAARRLDRNLGHNQRRMAFEARLPGAGSGGAVGDRLKR